MAHYLDQIGAFRALPADDNDTIRAQLGQIEHQRNAQYQDEISAIASVNRQLGLNYEQAANNPQQVPYILSAAARASMPHASLHSLN